MSEKWRTAIYIAAIAFYAIALVAAIFEFRGDTKVDPLLLILLGG